MMHALALAGRALLLLMILATALGALRLGWAWRAVDRYREER